MPLKHELLTPEQMGEADRLSILAGPLDGMGLMRRAGAAVAAEILKRYPEAPSVDILCGPGNNGGDGYVVARLLQEAGFVVRVWAAGTPRAGSDAALAADECPLQARSLSDFTPVSGAVVVDAIFGAGLSRPVDGQEAVALERCRDACVHVVAVDLPSGVSGRTGRILGVAVQAELTITFFRKKPGHLLYPGRELCGETVTSDIGIRRDVLCVIRPDCFENGPSLWVDRFPTVSTTTHKYARGHVGVFSGGPSSTGAARLSALAAARIGAGAVTMLSPANALQVNAAHLTSIILRRCDGPGEAVDWLKERKPYSLLFGPAVGLQEPLGELAVELVRSGAGIVGHIVFDADALTHISRRRDEFFEAFGLASAPGIVMTPHEGEFGRIFPELAGDNTLSKVDRAREAARRAGATIILKGPDTVIASPDGRAAINANAPPWLATAGSGDVLAGLTAGLLSQKMPSFEAACAAVWMHGEAGARFGPGLIAEDLPAMIPQLLRDITLGGSSRDAIAKRAP